MLASLIKPLPLLFTIAVTVGVLVHDTQIDRAAKTALALPGALASFVAIDSLFKASEHHVHVERASMPGHLTSIRANLPRLQPREDDRRYIQNKKLYFGGGDTNYIWPSV